jgi:hypothetical protein
MRPELYDISRNPVFSNCVRHGGAIRAMAATPAAEIIRQLIEIGDGLRAVPSHSTTVTHKQ